MSTTPSQEIPPRYRSNSEYLASLPPWRRLLARLNWHPVRGKEIAMVHGEARAMRLRRETEQLREQTDRIRQIVDSFDI